MKIHSDILTPTDIQAAVPNGCYLASFDHPGFGITRIGQAGSRSHERAYVVRLSGSTKSNMRNLLDKAATWEEWGNFIAVLFKLDPAAKIGWYGTREKFMSFTRSENERNPNNYPAPWLDEISDEGSADCDPDDCTTACYTDGGYGGRLMDGGY